MKAVLNDGPDVKWALYRWTEDSERAVVLFITSLPADEPVKELMGCSCMIPSTRTRSVQLSLSLSLSALFSTHSLRQTHFT